MEINIYKLFGRYGTRISLFCPVERVAEDTAGEAEESGAQGETSPFFYKFSFSKKLNEDGPRNIANLANQIHAKMIHISTDYVFDGSGSSPYTEDMPIAPIGVYGKTKADGEAAVRQNLKEHYIIRTAWLYGWAGKNFVYTMIKAMNTHDSVKVVNDQKGSPTFAGDLAGVIIKIIKKDDVPYGTYHCTDLGEITWWDFTNEIKKQGIEAGLITNRDCVVNPCATTEYLI